MTAAAVSLVGGAWPEGVPRDYSALFKRGSEWERFIQGRLRVYNKVGRNSEDLYQDICLKLMSAQVLEKFVKKAMTRLPPEMTAVEMCAYVGISYKKLEFFHWRTRNQDRASEKKIRLGQVPVFVPKPIRGGIYSRKAIYSRSDIIDFDAVLDTEGSRCRRNDGKFVSHKRKRDAVRDENGEFKRDAKGSLIFDYARDENGEYIYFEVGTEVARQVHFAPTGDGFRTYLGNAIFNHFANFCRTKSRKEKENLFAPDTVVSSTASGSYHVSASFEGGGSWEASLADLMTHPDEIEAKIDFASQFRDAVVEAGLDPDTLADYMAGLREPSTSKVPNPADIFDHMAKTGKDLADAFYKVAGVTLSRDLTRRVRGQRDVSRPGVFG